jgi:hypothetical protein
MAKLIAAQHRNLLGIPAKRTLASRFGAGPLAPESRLNPAKEAQMELRMRLNVLAAIVSFAFLTAIVFGMF